MLFSSPLKPNYLSILLSQFSIQSFKKYFWDIVLCTNMFCLCLIYRLCLDLQYFWDNVSQQLPSLFFCLIPCSLSSYLTKQYKYTIYIYGIFNQAIYYKYIYMVYLTKQYSINIYIWYIYSMHAATEKQSCFLWNNMIVLILLFDVSLFFWKRMF